MKRAKVFSLVLTSVLYGFVYGSTIRQSTSNNGTTKIVFSTRPSVGPCVPKVTQREWRKEDFPNPQVDMDKCGQNCKKSWICDPNHVFTNSYYVREIEDLLVRIRGNGVCGCTSCHGKGFKVSVALVNRMKFKSCQFRRQCPEWKESKERLSSSKKTERAREFASYLRSTAWHPNNTCMDDVVLFISRGDRKVQTAVGPRAVNVLTPACLEDVYNEAKSDLSAGRYGKAVYYMIGRYKQAILNGDCVSETSLDTGAIVGIVIGCIVVAGLFFLACFCVCCRICQGGGGYHSNHGGGFWGWSSGGGGGGGGGSDGGGFDFGGSGDGGGSGGGDF